MKSVAWGFGFAGGACDGDGDFRRFGVAVGDGMACGGFDLFTIHDDGNDGAICT